MQHTNTENSKDLDGGKPKLHFAVNMGRKAIEDCDNSELPNGMSKRIIATAGEKLTETAQKAAVLIRFQE